MRWLALAAMLVSACTSAQERCAAAQASARSAWQAHLSKLQRELGAAKATQAQSETRLANEVEPRLASAAADAVRQRYDANTDAYMRAYKAEQTVLCGRDPQCQKLRHDHHVATVARAELEPKITAVEAVVASAGGPAQAAQRAVAALAIEYGSPLFMAAKQASDAAFEACKDLR